MDRILDVRDLSVAFATGEGGVVRAVKGVSYSLSRGETLGIVGESGSGKSVHVLAMLGLLFGPPAPAIGGRVVFDGQDLLRMSQQQMRAIRGRRIGMVFQDPMTSLNPVLTIGRQMTEIAEEHLGLTHSQALRLAGDLLKLVHITDPDARLKQYPHEFSGGMRQRVMIAMALACEPKLLIADEPTTALDVTVQAQIIALVKELRHRLDMSIIWITHDLGVVAGLTNTVQVMYAGQILERGPVDAIFDDPRNAYTLGLLQSLPHHGGKDVRRRLRQIPGSPPDLGKPISGDPFAPRNPYATERCRRECPPLVQVQGGAENHLVAAWYDLREIRAREEHE